MLDQDQGYGGAAVRRHLTCFNSFDNYFYNRIKLGPHVTSRDRYLSQPHYNSLRNVTIPKANIPNPADGICSHFLLHGFNRVQKSPVTCGAFLPDARRLLLGTDDGNFTLWEAETFKFERLITASSHAIRAMTFKKTGSVLIMGDQSGFIHYFNNSLKLVYSTNAHDTTSLRDISCSPGDIKFATCGDNGCIKIWDWSKGISELNLNEHHSDVRCVDWHPFRGLIASGSKDNTIKMWDPRQSTSLATLHNHKNTVLCCEWNQNGNWLATGSRDFLVKIFDIRTMKEISIYKGHHKEVCSLAWHPCHEDVLVSGGFQGSLIYWMMGHEGPHTIIGNAHNYSVNASLWHPLGHCLATAANDGMLKIWGREPPGSMLEPIVNDYQDPPRVEYGPLPVDHKSGIPDASMQTHGGGGDRGERDNREFRDSRDSRGERLGARDRQQYSSQGQAHGMQRISQSFSQSSSDVNANSIQTKYGPSEIPSTGSGGNENVGRRVRSRFS